MSQSDALDHQHKPLLPAIPSLAGLQPKAACNGRILWQSRRGTLPTAPEICACNRARAVEGDAEAILAEIARKLAPMLRAARADLAAARDGR